MSRMCCWLVLSVGSLLFGGCAKPVVTASGISAPGLSETIRYTAPSPYVIGYSNGFKVLYLPDNELPLVKMALYVRGGTYWEDDRNFGIMDLMGAMMRKGGAGSRNADELDKRLRQLSASISSNVGGEYGIVSMECLDVDVDEVFGLLSDVVLRPRFQPDRLELLKKQVLEGISRRRDDPWSIASISFNQLLYGNSFLGRTLTSHQVRKVYNWQLRKAYKDFLRPDRAILTVTGRIPVDHVKELVGQEFGYLKGAVAPLPDLQFEAAPERPRIVYIESDLGQATVVFGQLGAPRYSPDHFPMLVYNEVFAGGMSSLLSKKIRSDLGLAYGVFGGIMPGLIRGKNVVAVQTKSATVGPAIAESIGLIERTRTNPLIQSLVDEKKRGMSASYVFAHDTPSSILGRIVSLDLMGYPETYDSEYLSRVSSVSPQDLMTLAQNRWHTGVMTIVIVGNQQALESFLSVRNQLPLAYQSLAVEQGAFRETLQMRPLRFTMDRNFQGIG
jgi:zinc protease